MYTPIVCSHHTIRLLASSWKSKMDSTNLKPQTSRFIAHKNSRSAWWSLKYKVDDLERFTVRSKGVLIVCNLIKMASPCKKHLVRYKHSS